MDSLNLFAVMAFVAFALALLVMFEWDFRCKWKRMYQTIRVVDMYIQHHIYLNPFLEKYGDVVVVTGKMLNRYGVPYIQYRVIGNHSYNESCPLKYFIEVLGFEPYKDE